MCIRDRSRQGRDDTGGRDPADLVVSAVAHIKIAESIHGDAEQIIELRIRASAVGETGDPGFTGQGRDHARRSHFPDGVALPIGDPNVAGTVNGEILRIIEPRGWTGPVDRRLDARGYRERGHDATRGDFSDRVVAGVSEVDGEKGIDRHATDAIERCARRRSVLAPVSYTH